ncbi:MAG: PAS domain-containing protein [Leptospiraceae bacterium]|nr:PAS domain-containing protein [Leptospiraceae bacterium]MBK7054473.1 PAS domain-containing protein [Leptospiraceae bacterium]MBL0262776.1 PAS domain-containing protein [Leptospiraceae bacterium]MBP9888945.1 PAS domain-containing protein [Leptospiraceae bacterium]
MKNIFNESFFTKNPIPMWVYDLATLQFLEVNEAATIVYGYSREEFLSMTIKDIRPSEDLPALLKVANVDNEGYADTGVWRHLKKNGELLYVNISGQVIEFQGRKSELILSIDQTERVNVFKQSSLNESKLNSILNSIRDIIWSSDPNSYEIFFVNKNVFDLYGYDAEDFYKNPNLWNECIFEEDRQKVMDAFTKIKEIGFFEEEYRIITKDKKIKWVKDKAWLVRDNLKSEIIRIDGISRDITEEKNNLEQIRELSEKAIKQNAFLREIAYINSHKLRGPLVSILAGLELLQEGADLESIILKIKKSGEELDQVIRSSLDFLPESEDNIFINPIPTNKKIQTIFCIDDDTLQLMVNRRIFNLLNSEIQLLTFEDPKDAFTSIHAHYPELIFLDLNMPEMNGWDFLDAMKKDRLNIDVYILTSSVDPYDKKKAETYENIKGFLSKPLSLQVLKNIIF